MGGGKVLCSGPKCSQIFISVRKSPPRSHLPLILLILTRYETEDIIMLNTGGTLFSPLHLHLRWTRTWDALLTVFNHDSLSWFNNKSVKAISWCHLGVSWEGWRQKEQGILGEGITLNGCHWQICCLPDSQNFWAQSVETMPSFTSLSLDPEFYVSVGVRQCLQRLP